MSTICRVSLLMLRCNCRAVCEGLSMVPVHMHSWEGANLNTKASNTEIHCDVNLIRGMINTMKFQELDPVTMR